MAENYADTTDVGAIIARHTLQEALAVLFRPRDPGDYYLRLLPRRLAAGQVGPFARQFGRHYDFPLLRGMPGTQPVQIVCPAATAQMICLADQVNEGLFRQAYRPDGSVDEAAQKRALSTKVAERHVCDILPVTPRNEAIPGQGVKIWEFGPTIMQGVRREFTAYGQGTNPVSLTDPQRGYVIRVTYKRGKGGAPSADSVGVHPVSGPIPYATWAEERHDLDEFVLSQIPTPEQMHDYFAHAVPGAQPHVVTATASVTAPYQPPTQIQPQPAVLDGTGPSEVITKEEKLAALGTGKLTNPEIMALAEGRMTRVELQAVLAR